MADRELEAKARKKALADEYAEKVLKHNDSLQKELSDEQYAFFRSYGTDPGNAVVSGLTDALRKPGALPSEYIQRKMNWMFGTAIAECHRAVLLYYVDRVTEYPYSVSYTRRSFRAKDISTYLPLIVQMIRRFSSRGIAEISLDKILNRELPEDLEAYLDEYSFLGCGYCAWQVAYALDRGDRKVEDAVRRILTEENGTGMLTSEIVRGVLYSHRSDFYELLANLLLAARLQEGLRQVICENADCGTEAGFLTLLKVIDENNLIRFSSVKRAVGTWLGLLAEESRDLERVSEKSVRLIIDCIERLPFREECLASEDAMALYISLWSYGFLNIESAAEQIKRIAENGSHHQLLVAGYFAANLNAPNLSSQIAKRVLSLHSGKDDVLAVWLPCFLPGKESELWSAVRSDREADYRLWFESKAEILAYYNTVKELYVTFPGKTKTFSPCVFPWYEAKIAKSDLAEVLCILASLSGDSEKIDASCILIRECNSDQRSLYFSLLLRTPKTETQRKTILECLADKESGTRKSAFRLADKLSLNAAEFRLIEEYLRYKNADIRNNVMHLLMKQSDSALTACISRLLDSTKEEVRLGGLDMLMQLKKDAKRSDLPDGFLPRLSERMQEETLPQKEKILLNAILPSASSEAPKADLLFTKEDHYLPTDFDADDAERSAKVFAAYFPDSRLPELIAGKKGGQTFLQKIKSAIVKNVACESAIVAATDLLSLSAFIDAHQTDSFVTSSGETILLSNIRFSFQLIGQNGKLLASELWNEWATSHQITNERLIRALILYHAYRKKTAFAETCAETIRTVFGTGFECGKELPHSILIGLVLESLSESVPVEERRKLASALTIWFIRCVPDDRVMISAPTLQKLPKSLEMAHLLAHRQLSVVYSWLCCRNDGDLRYAFPLAVASSERCIDACKRLPEEETTNNGNFYYYVSRTNTRVLQLPYGGTETPVELVGINAYLIAAYQGILTERQLYEFVFHPDHIRKSLEVISSVASCLYEKGRSISGHDTYKGLRTARTLKEFLGKEDEPNEDDQKLIAFVAKVYESVIPVVLASELSRGDSPAAYTNGIFGINRIYGAHYLAEILSAMGNDTLDRSAYSVWGSDTSRKSSLSYLLSVCIPAGNDTADTLRSSLERKKIGTKRLIEAALFSPEWIPLIGNYLGIGAFESVCYYFMAHMNERFDEKRKAIIARYTPLSEEELNLGAFDVNWFRSAYDSISEKEFDLIYDAAKYISDGAKHARARKYSDAALGKYSIRETEEAISEKRNKDLLMAYSLIPIESEDDICRRYLFIQNFRKESRTFGAQRAASEGKAADMALKNLAINAGYADTMRLTLRMETKVIQDNSSLLDEQTVDGVSFRIIFDDHDGGKVSLAIRKDGKELKSIPAKLKKHETVLAMTELKKTLTEQYRRTRVMLEEAMENETFFTFGELSALSAHPVVYPMLKRLVLVSGDRFGFLSETGLLDYSGSLHPLTPDQTVKIAHPFDLYKTGEWRNYQNNLFEHKITQPFRQVFRELYIKTEDEKETYRSLRYAGNQIQPSKTLATLKSRRWVADVENGLQKVYYRENIVAEIYALADWFSPADIESPTLEWVSFSDRQTGKELKISDVPDILFSEVMRDVDLAVSVAHAGGVDPETSHSTIEMRAAILSLVLPMFRIENVRIESQHAVITGQFADYSVHLGSGVVHQIGGAMIPVLPVQSQHRGKIFLPFADDDPKTAEIISKVLLFAEDRKIKDPMILSAIRKEKDQ